MKYVQYALRLLFCRYRKNAEWKDYKPVSLFIHSYVTSTATTRTFLHFMINAEMYNVDVLKHSKHKHNYTFTAKTILIK